MLLVLAFAKIELTDLPDRSLVDETSVRVKGSGQCTILHVSYADEPLEVVKLELVRLTEMSSLVQLHITCSVIAGNNMKYVHV